MICDRSNESTAAALRADSVLLVDDDELILEQLTIVLEAAGYRVQTAQNAQSALRSIEQNRCRYVVADWEMPDMDGPSLCRFIRERSAGEYIYVLLFTIRRGTDSIVEGLQAGADDYVVKGAPMAELVARLDTGRRLLADRATTRPGAKSIQPPPTHIDSDFSDRRGSPTKLAFAVAREYQECRRNELPISLLLCAPDDLGAVSRRFGAEIGAAFLTGLQVQIPKVLLGSDWVARRGYEGFVVVLPGTPLEGARFVGDKLRTHLAQNAAKATVLAHADCPTVSVGAASLEGAEDFRRFMPLDLLTVAEDCLAKGRRTGGNKTTAAWVRDAAVPSRRMPTSA